jgi:hypothetical protein
MENLNNENIPSLRRKPLKDIDKNILSNNNSIKINVLNEKKVAEDLFFKAIQGKYNFIFIYTIIY